MIALGRFPLILRGGIEQSLLIRAERQAAYVLMRVAQWGDFAFLIMEKVCAFATDIASAIAPEGNLLENAIGLVAGLFLQCLRCVSLCLCEITGKLIIVLSGEEEVIICYEH